MSDVEPGGPDPEQAVGLLLRDLRATSDGLSAAEADRRLLQYGTNELRRRRAVRWPAELAAQLTHPLALLLWVAAALSLAVGNVPVAIASARSDANCSSSSNGSGAGAAAIPKESAAGNGGLHTLNSVAGFAPQADWATEIACSALGEPS